MQDTLRVKGYLATIEPLPKAEGGGFMATVADLPGCMSDGTTVEETEVNLADAIEAWIDAAKLLKRKIPVPT